VRDQIGQLGTVYTGSLHDGEVVDHEAGNGAVELVDFDVISASDEQIELVAKAKAPVAFDVQYLDTSSAAWDSEDKEYIGGETETETFEQDVMLSLPVIRRGALLSLHRKGKVNVRSSSTLAGAPLSRSEAYVFTTHCLSRSRLEGHERDTPAPPGTSKANKRWISIAKSPQLSLGYSYRERMQWPRTD
jgi:hypothetical protein